MIKRWSGFDTQSLPWQLGYEWAYDRGPYAGMDCAEAIEAAGYDWGSPQDEEMQQGMEFAQNEMDGG